ncbi:MAG: serine/threonine-protein kinase [Kofleriaceae bacterium]
MIGERIGNFVIVSRLGAGGMGEVFLAEHEQIGTKVAIKMLQPHVSANTEHVQRFFNEAIAVSKIQHAGIGKIFDVGHHNGRAYLVMEYLDGETVGARIGRLGRLPLGMVCDIGKQICGVLEAVHKAGVTHRDLKPDNVFVVPDGELASGERVKILDFGIAKLSTGNAGLTATASGSMGTPAYMSPEQWKNSKTVDWRADAYSLGCLVFEMAAGQPPFVAETIGEACAKHLTEEPPRLASIVATPPALDSLVASLLAKDPDHRPASMRDIANAFAALAISPIGVASTQMSAPMMVPSVTGITNTTLGASAGALPASITQGGRSKKPWVMIVVGLGVAGVAAAVVAVVLSKRGDDPPKPAVAVAVVDPVVAVDAPAPVDAAVEPDAPIAADAAVIAIDAGVVAVHKDPPPKPRPQPPKPLPPPPEPIELPKRVTNRLRYMQNQYGVFRARNGNRLEAEHAALVRFVQQDGASNNEKLRRINRFLIELDAADPLRGPPVRRRGQVK